MKSLKQRKFLIFLILIIFITGCQNDPITNNNLEIENGQTQQNESIEANLPFNLKFATPDEAAELLSSEDTYLSNLTQFDLESKTRAMEPSVDNYIKIANQSVATWDDSEIEKIKLDLVEINKRINDLELNLIYPDEIYFIKSSIDEESNAHGYTRRNFIVLNENYISKNLIIHELWHVISRYNPEKANKIYNSIGFVENQDIKFPAKLKKQIITNPDATNLKYTIKVKHKGIEKDAVLLIYSDRPYKDGKFFEYLKLGLYFPNHIKDPFTFDQITPLSDVDGFYEQIGKNTNYLLHAEEITAEHFRLLIIDEYKYLEDSKKIEMLKEILEN